MNGYGVVCELVVLVVVVPGVPGVIIGPGSGAGAGAGVDVVSSELAVDVTCGAGLLHPASATIPPITATLITTALLKRFIVILPR